MTSRLRQQKFRKEHITACIHNQHALVIEALQVKYAQLTGESKVTRNEAITRALIDTHAKYYPIGGTRSQPPDSDNSEVMLSNDPALKPEGSLGDVAPNDTVQPSPIPGSPPENVVPNGMVSPPSIPELEPEPVVTHNILTTSEAARMHFNGGLIWQGGGLVLKVRFIKDPDRRFKLTTRGFKGTKLDEGYVWTSLPSSNEGDLANFAIEVLREIDPDHDTLKYENPALTKSQWG